MSHTQRLGGSVLGEQTLLAFSSHPPSSGCSAVLPSAVCEGRGGERRFAMNQRTQLQFNLGIAPDHGKLATNFTPSHPPSPVTIHKAAAETIGISCTPVQNFKAVSPSRLAMAMKLAKRNARSTQDMRVYKEEDSEETDESIEEVELEPHSLRNRDVRGYIPPEAIDRELGELRLELEKRIERLDRSKGAGKRPTEGVTNRLNGRTVGDMGERGNRSAVNGRGRGVGLSQRMSGGVGGSRSAMWPNNMRMGRTRGGGVIRANRHGGMGRDGAAKVVNDRICWENLDDTQEREQQWRDERMARNTRMMYDLSQQVKVLRKQASKKKPQQSTQPVIVQKLAAAQRAALRTLQGFSHSGRGLIPIPPELTFLIQQLGLLSTQLGGGVNTEMSDDLRQLMVKLDSNQVPKSMPTNPSVPEGDGQVSGRDYEGGKGGQVNERDGQPNGEGSQPDGREGQAWTTTKCVSGKRKKRNRGGVLFTSLRHQRKLGQDFTHFTDSTFNSARRQQPPLLYTPCRDCSPQVQQRAVSQGTPRFCHLHLSPADFKLRKKKARKVLPQSPRYTKSPLPARSPISARKKKKVSRKLQKKSKKDVDGDKENVTDLVDQLCSEDEPEMTAAELSSAIAGQANQLQELRREISQKLAELKSGREGGEAERSNQLSNTIPALDTNLPLEDYHDARLASMLRRLEELEAEEDAIRQRWNTISYEDPLVTRPSVQEETPRQVVVTPRNLEPGASLPVLSSQSLSSIEQYRQQYRNHLNLTANTASQGGASNPWKVAESIADDILREALEGVASEVELLCDNCVEELYNYEFIRPP